MYVLCNRLSRFLEVCGTFSASLIFLINLVFFISISISLKLSRQVVYAWDCSRTKKLCELSLPSVIFAYKL